nr:MAG TPA: hypothetical protein [Caudoviricetes sp.]
MSYQKANNKIIPKNLKTVQMSLIFSFINKLIPILTNSFLFRHT